MASIKSLLAGSPDLTTIPSKYTFVKNPKDETIIDDPELKIPTIDFSLLTSDDSDQRSKVITELGHACENWGFFMLTNHGVPDSVMNGVLESCKEFFDMREEDKSEFVGKDVLDPIRYGTSFNVSVDKVLFWRDYLKVMVHPHFHFPNKPSGFSEVALDYFKRINEVVKGISKGISESLGLETDYIEKALNLKSGLGIFAANLYPTCPQPDLAMGLPPHSDHCLMTILIQNGTCGLQIQHNGKWVNVNPIPNSLSVICSDQLEILSNGKYNSVIHRAVVNNNATRISLAIASGPDLETVVSPAQKLVQDNENLPVYYAIKYKNYLEMQQSNTLKGNSMLDRVRLV